MTNVSPSCPSATFVDCTGGADLAARAERPCQKGDDRGRMQPSTRCFLIAGLSQVIGDDLRTDPCQPIVKAASLAGYRRDRR